MFFSLNIFFNGSIANSGEHGAPCGTPSVYSEKCSVLAGLKLDSIAHCSSINLNIILFLIGDFITLCADSSVIPSSLAVNSANNISLIS
jgi:hypothetical protein